MICLHSFINYRRPVDPILRFFFPLLEFFFFALDPILEERSIFLEIANHLSIPMLIFLFFYLLEKESTPFPEYISKFIHSMKRSRFKFQTIWTDFSFFPFSSFFFLHSDEANANFSGSGLLSVSR